MFVRAGVIAFNTYRESVRARILHGLFAAALGTGAYSLVVGALTLRNDRRVVADLGAFFISLFGIVVAVVLSSSSLYRELELKTIFPILARPIRRSEYLVGKFLGTVLTLLTFISANVGALLLAIAQLSGQPWYWVAGVGLGGTAAFLALGFAIPRWRTALPIPWALFLSGAGWLLAAGAPDDRRVLVGLATLTLLEVWIVAAVSTVFASFSSPFLTAIFSFGIFLVGRSADTLARLPPKVFGEEIHAAGEVLSRVVPNLMVYVPSRSLLTGEMPDTPLDLYLLYAAGHALAWTVGLLVLASLIFRKRDFL